LEPTSGGWSFSPPRVGGHSAHLGWESFGRASLGTGLESVTTKPPPLEQWTRLMDEMTKAAQELAKVAKKEGVTQAEAKKAYTAVNASCTACHKVFRIDEP
jgi:cytochrome c556